MTAKERLEQLIGETEQIKPWLGDAGGVRNLMRGALRQVVPSTAHQMLEDIKALLPEKAKQSAPSVLGAQTPWLPANEVEAYNAALDNVTAVLERYFGDK